MRRGEASKLEMRDIDRDNREITIRRVNAKNDEKRIIAYQPSLDGLLQQWVDRGQRDAYNTDNLPYLFIGERGARLSGGAISDVVRKAAIEAGVNRKLDYEDANSGSRWLITAHNVRHGFGTYLVNETDAGLYEVSKQMGHSSVDVTEEIYVSDDPRAGLQHIRKYGPD
jgi:integrase/recombinase XerD